MASFHFSALADGAVLDFVPTADVLVFSDPALSASQLSFVPGADGTGLTISLAGKTITLENLTPFTLRSDAFSFADGSRVLSLTARTGGDLSGGAGGDVLIGSGPAHGIAMVSVAASETSGAASGGVVHGLSADGRYALFSGSSDDIVAGDTNGQIDVFRRDMLTGTTTRVSVTAEGAEVASNGSVFGPGSSALSDDGRLVAFSNFSDAFGGRPGTFEAYVKNLDTGAVQVVNTDSQGNLADASGLLSSFSANGRYVVIDTSATNLDGTLADTNGVADVYLKDTLTGTMTRVSVAFGTQGNASSSGGQVSADGRYVAYQTAATNLFFGDANGASDVLRLDLRSGSTTLVSQGTGGNGDAASNVRAISADGQRVLFTSTSSNLVAGDGAGTVNLFLRDLRAGTTVAVDTDASGTLGSGGTSDADLSADGRYVAFVSSATNLVPGVSGNSIVYLKDLVTGAIAVVSVDAAGEPVTGNADARLSADGSHVMFRAVSDTLDPGVGGGGSFHAYTVANPLLSITLAGGAGNDSYLVARAADRIVETAGGGTDTVRASVSVTLAANVENLVLTGSANLDGTGNASTNVLTGNAGDNRLDGGAGTDTASYAAATDAVSVGLDVPGLAQDTGGAGIDTLLGIENLTGSAFDDVLLGNAGANLLDGGKGVDLMAGGAGNDTYVIDSALDQLVEAAAGGTDTVRTLLSHTLAAEFENLMLLGSGNLAATGNAGNNVLTGNTGSNRLNGGSGTDTASYAGARAGVVVGLDLVGPQSTGAGIDTLLSIESLRGSSHDDTLHGNAGSNVLDGGSGTDTLSYARAAAAVTVDLSLTTAQATGGAGTDTVTSFENLTGSAFADTLRGSSADNRLDGGVGADTMIGGAGNDSYIVNSALDRVVEVSGGGIDIVFSASSHTLGNGVEQLTLTGTGNTSAIGNAASNLMVGNSGANVLNGGDGTDTVSYEAATTAVGVNLATGIATGGGGSDTLISIENLIGTGLADSLVGNGSANILTAGLGADTVTGGAGIDIFVFTTRSSADTVTDFVSGTDRLRFSQAGVRVGDGDTVIDGAVTVAGPGGFAASAELVIVSGDAASLSRADAAAAIGSASTFYDAGSTALFAVDNGVSTGLYRFTSSSGNVVVSADELTLIGILQGTASTAIGDYSFIS